MAFVRCPNEHDFEAPGTDGGLASLTCPTCGIAFPAVVAARVKRHRRNRVQGQQDAEWEIVYAHRDGDFEMLRLEGPADLSISGGESISVVYGVTEHGHLPIWLVNQSTQSIWRVNQRRTETEPERSRVEHARAVRERNRLAMKAAHDRRDRGIAHGALAITGVCAAWLLLQDVGWTWALVLGVGIGLIARRVLQKMVPKPRVELPVFARPNASGTAEHPRHPLPPR